MVQDAFVHGIASRLGVAPALEILFVEVVDEQLSLSILQQFSNPQSDVIDVSGRLERV